VALYTWVPPGNLCGRRNSIDWLGKASTDKTVASSLADFQGNAIYLDTNVLVGLVDAGSVYHPACAAFFQRAVDPDRPIQLFTATLTLDEVIFVLLQETVAREPYSITRNRSQYLRDHPDVVRELMMQLDPLASDVCNLVALEPVVAADISEMRQEMRDHGTLPRDAIHLAVMKRLGLTAIASDDEGFDNRRGIDLFMP
jgi:predicted nucleic acid-binding protein